jgi:hypothetical protein
MDGMVSGHTTSFRIDKAMSGSEQVKATLATALNKLLDRGRVLLERVRGGLATVQSTDVEWGDLFKRLQAASAQLPVRPFNRYYQRELKRASEPLFLGIMSDFNDGHYGEISSDYVADLIDKYQTPAVRVTEAVFDDVASFFRDTSARVLTLRFFSNSEVLLQKFDTVLAPPWAQAINVPMPVKNFRLPIGIGTPVIEHPPHLEIFAIRDANENTLRILERKLHEIVATLETTLTELPFAEKLEKPQPVPQTLIDLSTNIGAGANVRDSAIGKSATRGR